MAKALVISSSYGSVFRFRPQRYTVGIFVKSGDGKGRELVGWIRSKTVHLLDYDTSFPCTGTRDGLDTAVLLGYENCFGHPV